MEVFVSGFIKMSNSEETELSFVTKLTSKDTFQLWDFEMQILYKAKQLWEVVHGDDILANHGRDEKAIKAWNAKDAKAQYYIVRTLDKMVKGHILSCTTSKEMYDTLKSVYRRDTGQIKQQLLLDFHGYNFDKTKDMMSNLSLIRNIAFKLKQLKIEVSDDMVMAKILYTLPDQYHAFISAWESTPAVDKTIENLISRLCTEEEYRQTEKQDQPGATFSANSTKSSNGNVKGKNKYFKRIVCHKCGAEGHIKPRCPHEKYCLTCNRDNHNKDECFKKNAVKSQTTIGKFPTCIHCKRSNHAENNCWFKSNNSKPKPVFLTETQETTHESHFVNTEDNSIWIVDSGCTSHMSNDSDGLKSVRSSDLRIRSAKKGEDMIAQSMGNLETEKVSLTNVSYVPQLSRNLMSVSSITKNGGEVLFKKGEVLVFKNNEVVLNGSQTNSGLYQVNVGKIKEALFTETNPEEWHKLMGHISYGYLKKLPDLCEGVPQSLKKCVNKACDVCCAAKMCRKPFNTVRHRATHPLQIIHTDLCGSIEPPTCYGEKYFLTVVDDFTHFVQVYLLKTKNVAEDKLMQCIQENENQHNLRVWKIRVDNGGEFRSKRFKTWCQQKGIRLEYTIPHTSQLNGTAERMNRSIAEKMRALLYEAKLHEEMWGTAAEMAAYLLNRSPSSTVPKTPAEMWFGRKQDLSRLKLYGAKVGTKVLGHLKKIDCRGNVGGIMIGYTENGYRIWDPERRTIYRSHDVEDFGIPQERKRIPKITIDDLDESKEENSENQNENDKGDSSDEPEDPTDEKEENQNDSNVEEPDGEEQHIIGEQPVMRPQRHRQIPKYLQDCELDLENLLTEETPVTYEDCMKSPDKLEWIKAIEEEKQCLANNKTWTLVDPALAVGKEVITSRWIFRKKEDGRFRARLVARGCQQQTGKLDYEDIYTSVVQSNTLRLLLAVAASENLEIATFDIKSAFLYGTLKQEIYMKLPEDFKTGKKICHLKKSLYGLKQAPQQWFTRLTDFLKTENMVPLNTDQCVFKPLNKNKKLFVAVHVDDGLIIGEDLKQIQNLMTKLNKQFDMTINYNPKNYLGMQISQTEDGIFLSQARYAQEVVESFDMSNSKPVKTPISNQEKRENLKTDISGFPYQEAIGKLLYLACKTRPDLSFAVNYASRHINDCTTQDVANIKRTLRYLNATKEDGIFFSKQKDSILQVFTDSDHAGDRNDSKSTTGYTICFAGAPIAWVSRKQTGVAQSSTEAEYVAAATCCRETKFVKTVLEELLSRKFKVDFYVDNQSCIKMIKSGQLTKKCVFIDVKFHYVKDEYKKGWFTLNYCPTDQQVADIFTKPLSPEKFLILKKKLMP